MTCPVCRHSLIVVEYQRIELDYCPHCHGVWFDSGELDLLLKTTGRENERQFLAGIIGGPEAESTEARRRCPICRQPMKKVAISKAPPVHIDACPRGNGLWFDGGEVNVLLQELDKKTGDNHAVASFLSEVFQARR